MMAKCKLCGMNLEVFDSKEEVHNMANGEKVTTLRKMYQCTNSNCANYNRYTEPDCEHDFGNMDFGAHAFEHCYYCSKCNYMVCYDSSG
jgi:hypothetical protein